MANMAMSWGWEKIVASSNEAAFLADLDLPRS
jgi:hypothetical protein